MTIHLPEHLERYVHDQVQAGRYLTEDELISDAIERHRQAQQPAIPAGADPLLGVWRDAVDEIDEIVADAMQHRREEPWRAIPGE